MFVMFKMAAYQHLFDRPRCRIYEATDGMFLVSYIIAMETEIVDRPHHFGCMQCLAYLQRLH
jgi:hypothetical protein